MIKYDAATAVSGALNSALARTQLGPLKQFLAVSIELLVGACVLVSPSASMAKQSEQRCTL